jgi:hypothetical protein
MPAGAEETAKGWLRDPVRIVVGLKYVPYLIHHCPAAMA